jgi:nitrile hydratase
MFARWRRENTGWTLDWWRHVLERIEPADYLAMNYFDKWAQSCMAVLVEEGTADINDFVSDVAGSKSPEIVERGKRASVRQAVPSATDSADASKAMFEVGDTVTGKLSVSAMHTRLPAYARGRSGLVSTHHGMQILPDASARGEIRKEHLYTVAFKASDLWPKATDRKDKVYIDLWESYLEPAR